MADPALCRLEDVSVRFRSSGGPVTALDRVSCSIGPGEIVGVTGESGSGKSTLGAVILDHLPEAAVPPSGRVVWRQPRPRTAWIPQEPQAALNPVLTIAQQVVEAIHLPHPDVAARDRHAAVALLLQAGCREARSVAAAYPHQLSGGLCQRVLIAMAMARHAELVVADEATESLDPTTQAGVCRQLRGMVTEHGASLLFISHDLPLVAAVAQRLLVMHAGRVVEAGPVERLFGRPQHAHTRQLLAALPSPPAPPGAAARETAAARRLGAPAAAQAPERPEDQASRTAPSPVAALQQVVVRFARREGALTALDRVTLTIQAGELYGLVGESGAGKSTLARCLTGLQVPDAGDIRVVGFAQPHALTGAAERSFRRRCRYLPQPAKASLNPRLTVLEHFLEAFDAVAAAGSPPAASPGAARRGDPTPARHWLEVLGLAPAWLGGGGGRRAYYRRTLSLLQQAGLGPDLARRYAHQLSGGQARRVGFALAMASEPDLIVADEPFSGLDLPASVRLLDWLQQVVAQGCALVIVSHRLDLVAAAAARIGVLHEGRLVEEAPTPQLWHNARAEPTRALLAALPARP